MGSFIASNEFRTFNVREFGNIIASYLTEFHFFIFFF